jgi:hypothetical protein
VALEDVPEKGRLLSTSRNEPRTNSAVFPQSLSACFRHVLLETAERIERRNVKSPHFMGLYGGRTRDRTLDLSRVNLTAQVGCNCAAETGRVGIFVARFLTMGRTCAPFRLDELTASGRLSLRSNFAVNYMRVAIRDAQAAYDVEQANDTNHFGSWFDDMMMHVPVAVVMAAAALEANINEIIQDILDKSPHALLTKGNTALLKDLKADRSGNAMGKYRKLGLLLDKVPITNSPAWLNADILFRFRNSLMHFKPAWDSETDIHDGKLVRDLKQRIPITPAYRTGFMFPYGFLTYGCAKWAVESARALSGEFCTLIVVNDRFSGTIVLP